VRDYALEVEELEECVYSRGHHSPAQFIDHMEAETTWDCADLEAEHVKHEWWRIVPNRLEGGCDYVGAKPESRGSFPVTVVHEW